MIWDDPWCILASKPGGTDLPPIRYPLSASLQLQVDVVHLSTWTQFVRSRLSKDEIKERLQGAHVISLKQTGKYMATCVIRKRQDNLFILETLRAHHGYATPLLQQVMRILYEWNGTRFSLGYMWELSTVGLLFAWMKGWMNTAITIERGWIWKSQSNQKPKLKPDVSKHNGVTIVKSSQTPDGVCGELLEFTDTGTIDWVSVAEGWEYMWYHGVTAPAEGWCWSGEWVVFGVLNQQKELNYTWWPHAEI